MEENLQITLFIKRCLQVPAKKYVNCNADQIFMKLHPDSSGQVSVCGTPFISIVWKVLAHPIIRTSIRSTITGHFWVSIISCAPVSTFQQMQILQAYIQARNVPSYCHGMIFHPPLFNYFHIILVHSLGVIKQTFASFLVPWTAESQLLLGPHPNPIEIN